MAALSLTEGKLKFQFPAGWIGSAYDTWAYYRNQFQKACAADHKAVDFIVKDTDSCMWLIEVKDYREHRRTKTLTVWDEMATKVRDSLAGLLAAKYANGHDHQSEAVELIKAKKLRVVLHFEQPPKTSKLFPRAFNLQDIQAKLRSKRYLKAIDPHVLVIDSQSKSRVAWSVTPTSNVQ
jgi:hypothetical protein